MRKLTNEQYEAIKKNYADNYKKISVMNWDVKGLDVSFSINDYEGNYTIIKFDEKVKLPDGTIGQKFCLNGKRMNRNAPVRFDYAF